MYVRTAHVGELAHSLFCQNILNTGRSTITAIFCPISFVLLRVNHIENFASSVEQLLDVLFGLNLASTITLAVGDSSVLSNRAKSDPARYFVTQN